MAKAEEEHHVAKMLIEEIKRLDRSSDSTTYDAKFTVLAENVKHHIGEEETEMLPKAKELGKEKLEELGRQMEQRNMAPKNDMPAAGSRGSR